MSKPDGGPAFPCDLEDFNAGTGGDMSLRLWLAGHAGEEAMQVLTLLYGIDELDLWGRDDLTSALAEIKLALADAMLNKLNKDATQTGETNDKRSIHTDLRASSKQRQEHHDHEPR